MGRRFYLCFITLAMGAFCFDACAGLSKPSPKIEHYSLEYPAPTPEKRPALPLPTFLQSHPDPARRVFVMRRVDEQWTCETTRERLPSLLSPARP